MELISPAVVVVWMSCIARMRQPGPEQIWFLSLFLEGEIWRCVLRRSLIHYSPANGRRGEVARTMAVEQGFVGPKRPFVVLGTPKRLWGISRGGKKWQRVCQRMFHLAGTQLFLIMFFIWSNFISRLKMNQGAHHIEVCSYLVSDL